MHFWLVWASAGIWIAFILYWNATGGKAAAASGADSGARGGRRRWIQVQFKVGKGAAASSDSAAREGAGSRESAKSRSVHQLLLLSAILVALLPGFPPLNRRWLPAAPWIGITGFAIQVVFAMLYIWGKRHLGRFWSGAIATRADHQLVRSGPYRWLRHPLYTGLIGMFVGTAIVSGEWHGMVGLAMGVVAYWRKIRLEERHLSEQFGAEYERYRRESWALIPGIF